MRILKFKLIVAWFNSQRMALINVLTTKDVRYLFGPNPMIGIDNDE